MSTEKKCDHCGGPMDRVGALCCRCMDSALMTRERNSPEAEKQYKEEEERLREINRDPGSISM